MLTVSLSNTTRPAFVSETLNRCVSSILAHELSAEDRRRSANTDEYTRTLIGYLWERIHSFVAMPSGTDAHDIAWRAEIRNIDRILEPFCELCRGSGMAYRTITRHPVAEWEDWLTAGVLFSVNRFFRASVISGQGIVTGDIRTAHIRNYVRALNQYSDGIEDLDFDRVLTSAGTTTPGLIVPHVTGSHSVFATSLLYHWRTEWDRYEVLYSEIEGTPSAEQAAYRTMYLNWCANQIMQLLSPAILAVDVARARLRDSRGWTAGLAFSRSRAQTVTFLNFFKNKPFWEGGAVYLISDARTFRRDSDIPLIPAAQLTDGVWNATDRDAMRSRIQGRLGVRPESSWTNVLL